MAGEAIRVEGLKELRQALGQIGGPPLQKNLRSRFKKVGDEVAADIRPTVPAKSGRARQSLRSGVSGNKAYIQAGGTAAPYFGWLDWGGDLKPTGGRKNTIRRQRRPGGRYIYPGIDRKRGRIEEAALD